MQGTDLGSAWRRSVALLRPGDPTKMSRLDAKVENSSVPTGESHEDGKEMMGMVRG